MLYVTVAEAVLVMVLLLVRERDAHRLERLLTLGAQERQGMLAALERGTRAHADQLERFLAEAATERRSLLDRVQHPERVQVAPGPVVEHEVPRDSAEMAQVGQVVPDGVHVGEPDAGS